MIEKITIFKMIPNFGTKELLFILDIESNINVVLSKPYTNKKCPHFFDIPQIQAWSLCDHQIGKDVQGIHLLQVHTKIYWLTLIISDIFNT